MKFCVKKHKGGWQTSEPLPHAACTGLKPGRPGSTEHSGLRKHLSRTGRAFHELCHGRGALGTSANGNGPFRPNKKWSAQAASVLEHERKKSRLSEEELLITVSAWVWESWEVLRLKITCLREKESTVTHPAPSPGPNQSLAGVREHTHTHVLPSTNYVPRMTFSVFLHYLISFHPYDHFLIIICIFHNNRPKI